MLNGSNSKSLISWSGAKMTFFSGVLVWMFVRWLKKKNQHENVFVISGEKFKF